MNPSAALAAIIAEPDRDEARLVHADWLADRGDPRGELISTQCALAVEPDNEVLRGREQALLAEHGASWAAELGLLPDEARFVRGFVEAVSAPLSALSRWKPALWKCPLRELAVETDLGGNEEETAELIAALASELPAGLRRFSVDRRRYWDDAVRGDAIESPAAQRIAEDMHRPALRLELGEASGPRAILELARQMGRRASDLHALDIAVLATGPVEFDDVLDAAGDIPGLRELVVEFDSPSAREWMRWLSCERLPELLERQPALELLRLPMAKHLFEHLDHDALETLELNWLGTCAMGPSDIDGHGRPDRGVGLEFLRSARLPGLRRLGIHFQYDWYVGWLEEDVRALVSATLPSLRDLRLLDSLHGDLLCELLPDSELAAQLETLELGDISDDGARALLRHRERFASLERMITVKPLAVSDELWAELQAVYPISSETTY